MASIANIRQIGRVNFMKCKKIISIAACTAIAVSCAMIASADSWKDTYYRCAGNDYITKTYGYAEAYSYDLTGAASLSTDLVYYSHIKKAWTDAYGYDSCAPRYNPYVSVRVAPEDCVKAGVFSGCASLPNKTHYFWDKYYD